MSQNFCVIDIGTNTVKCKMFANGEYLTPRNKFLSGNDVENLDKEQIVSHISDFMEKAQAQGIDKNKIYIAATEGLRRSKNKDEIIKEILEKFGRKVHIVSPKREAWLSALGGLSSVNFDKANPKQVLYIESGGGSTEVSLIDTSRKPMKLVSSISLPLGSKQRLINDNEDDTNDLISKLMNEIVKDKKGKNRHLDPSLRVVINSTSASCVVGKQHKLNKINHKYIADKQFKIGIANFCKASTDIINQENDEALMKDFALNKETISGFKNHIYIINSVLQTLKNKSKAPFISRIPITTTIGGFKDGLLSEIIEMGEKTPDEIEDSVFFINNKDNKTSDDKKEIKKNASNWIDDYKEYYTKKNKNYICELNDEKDKLTVKDNKNEVTYSSPNKVDISHDENSTNNRLYEDMIRLAKEKGITNIKFEDNVKLETKLRMYAACKKHGMKIQNFEFNSKMLDTISPETKKIVNFAHKESLPKRRQERTH